MSGNRDSFLKVRPLTAYTSATGRGLLTLLLSVYFFAYVLGAFFAPMPLEWWLDNLVVILFWLWVWHYRDGLYASLFTLVVIMGFMYVHLTGAFYVYENVPMGEWWKDWFGWQRNHFDRLAHFYFGLCFTLLSLENIRQSCKDVREWMNWVFSASLIIAISAIYEILEMIVVLIVDREAGAAFLGSQGDEWDAQADILVAVIGAGLAILMWTFLKPREYSK